MIGTADKAVFKIFSDIERHAKLKKGIISERKPTKIEDLIPVTSYDTRNGYVTRYKFLDLINIINWKICGDQRRYGSCFEKYNNIIVRKGTTASGGAWNVEIGDDFWMTQIELFNREFRNDQNNALYIGLDVKVLERKLGREITEFEFEMQKTYNSMFKHLAHNKKKDRIKVRVSW